MTGPLEWNALEEAQHEAQRRAIRGPQEAAEAKERAALRESLPAREQSLANAQANVRKGRLELAELERQQGEAWQVYLMAYHRDGGGRTPRQGSGELVLISPMEGMAADALAAVPARREWQAHQEATQRVVKGQAALRDLEAIVVEQRAALEQARNA